MEEPTLKVIIFTAVLFLSIHLLAVALLILYVCDLVATGNNNLIPRKGDVSPKRRTCPNDNNAEKASRDIEVVHIIDDEQMPDTQKEVDVVRTTSQGNIDTWISIPAHQLELSLGRSDYSNIEDHEKNDRRTLKHSTSSAFSL
jgi:pseudo-response regulator 5